MEKSCDKGVKTTTPQPAQKMVFSGKRTSGKSATVETKQCPKVIFSPRKNNNDSSKGQGQCQQSQGQGATTRLPLLCMPSVVGATTETPTRSKTLPSPLISTTPTPTPSSSPKRTGSDMGEGEGVKRGQIKPASTFKDFEGGVVKKYEIKPASTFKDFEEEDDAEEQFAKNLNGIILQYLESCGLVETYTTFYDECKSSGMLIPYHFSPEIESGMSLQDVETLLMHFDQENGVALLEFWELLISMVDVGQNNNEIDKITFFIQVYIAIIPYRQKMSEEKRSASMSKLREYFQTKSEACTMDKEMLSLFALPFVADPQTHPVFETLFQPAWVKKLRSRIKNLSRALCSPNKLITRDKTDLAKMFRTCSSAVPHEILSSEGKKMCILSNAQPVEFTSGISLIKPTTPDSDSNSKEFNLTHMFQRLNDLILENERFKAEESTFEKQCSQLLSLSLLLAQSLEDAAQGREVNMDQLRHQVNICLPIPRTQIENNQSDSTAHKQSANLLTITRLSSSENMSSDSEDDSNPNILFPAGKSKNLGGAKGQESQRK